MASRVFVVTLSCRDEPGIVAAVTGELAARGCNIAESAQFWDQANDTFFMRIAFSAPEVVSRGDLEKALAPASDRFGMRLSVIDRTRRPRIIILVSKFDHALQHLLYQLDTGWLDAEVAAIVSNHKDAQALAAARDLPFHYWPVTKETKPEQEDKLLDLVRGSGADLVILARYMQILSDSLASTLFGRVMNIHHSFLPSFKGARPYHQAHARGVKVIGATAHFVTGDLDEGPIIHQDVEPVDHTMSPDDLVAVGRDIENRVLARAVKLCLDRRVMLNGNKTVVFR